MACEISEFERRAADSGGAVDVFPRPPLAVQPPIAMDATVRRSAAFAAKTRFVRLTLTADARIRVYPVPAAADTTAVDPSGADGLSEFFPAGEHVLGVAPGSKLAIVAAVSA